MGNKINLTLTVTDDDGNVVDHTDINLDVQQIEQIVDRAADVSLVFKTTALSVGDERLARVLLDLKDALISAKVI